MRKVSFYPIILLLAFNVFSSNLSLKKVIFKAMENNPEILIAKYNPRRAKNLWQASKGMFIPVISLSGSASKDQQKPSSIFEGRSDKVDSDRQSAQLSLNQNLPFGGQVTFSVSQNRNYTTNLFYQLNPSYTTLFQFTLSQPLLKNAGSSVAKQNIIISKKNYEKSLLDFKAQVSSTILDVVQAYWNYLYYLEAYRVKKESLKLAQDLLRQNQEMVKVGRKSPLDIVEAESEVENRRAEVIEAKNQVENAREVLRLKTGLEYIPEDPSALQPPKEEAPSLDLDSLLQHAFSHNPQILSAKKDLETAEFNMGIKKNALKPQLDLQLSVSTIGRAGDRLIYANNNPFSGVVVGKITGSPYDSINEALKGAYNSVSLQLVYSMPVKRLKEVGEFRAAVADYYRAKENYRKVVQDVEYELRSAWRDALAAYHRMLATKKARELAERKLQAEQIKFSQGASTNYMVLTYQRDLANAKINELKAVLDYNVALFRVKKAAGLLLEDFGIKIKE